MPGDDVAHRKAGHDICAWKGSALPTVGGNHDDGVIAEHHQFAHEVVAVRRFQKGQLALNWWGVWINYQAGTMSHGRIQVITDDLDGIGALALTVGRNVANNLTIGHAAQMKHVLFSQCQRADDRHMGNWH